ncbi:hypothetical protein CR513_47761, partial [Mucuna pruriens]
MTLGFTCVLQYGLQSSSTCNKVTHFGTVSDSPCSKLFVNPNLRPGNDCFIIWVLGLVMRPPISCQLSLTLLVGSLSPQVLWSYHTTPNYSTNETPFHLTFSIEVVILVEIGEPSPKTALIQSTENEDELREARDIVQVKEYAMKARAARCQARRLAPRRFKPSDLVPRKVTRTEGSFRIAEEVSRGAYCLEQLDGKKIPWTWNTMNLRLYYN